MTLSTFKFISMSAFVPIAMLAMADPADAQQTSSYCKFEAGNLQGQIRDYGPVQVGPIGTPCYDESRWGDSRGVVIAPPSSPNVGVIRGSSDQSPQSVR